MAEPSIIRIPLSLPYGREHNAWLLPAEPTAVVNPGPIGSVDALRAGLAEHSVRPTDVRRFLYSSWEPDNLGAARAFPRAAHLVPSADMQGPRAWDSHVEATRADLLGLVDELLEARPATGWTREDAEVSIAALYPRGTNQLDFVPVGDGRIVRAGGMTWEAVHAPGPSQEHTVWWSRETASAFLGDFPTSGLPDFTSSLQAYVGSLEELARLGVHTIFPSHGPAQQRASWVLQAALRAVSNFIAVAPTRLSTAQSLLEFVEADLGHEPDDIMVLVGELRRFQSLLEGLVDGGALAARGAGVYREFGTSFR